MRWAAAIATDIHLDDAVSNVAEEVTGGLGGARADLVLVFVTDHHAGRFGRLSSELEAAFPSAIVVGCTAGGALAGGLEIEHQPALSVVAASLPDVRVTGFRAGETPRRWTEEIDVDEGADVAFLLLPDPLTCPADELLDWMDERWPSAPKVGGLASGGMTTAGPPSNTLFLGGERLTSGAVGVALEGDLHVDTVVAQGCRPIGEPLIVTRAHRNVASELDGEPAIHAIEKLVATLSPADQSLARHSLFLGLAMTGGGPLGKGDFLIRNLIGIDRASGALAAGAPMTAGQIVQFHLRDAKTADGDLREMLSLHEGAAPEGALMFSCVGRGQGLYGAANHDSGTFHSIIGDVPLGGFFCNGEIGPVHRRTFLHGYTSAFALIRRRLALA
jgi:small ligand-binding sensory domain FIST